MIFPSTIPALNPLEVRCERWKGLNTVRLQLFGIHSTGGKDTPFYGLVVVVTKPEGNMTELIRGRIYERRKVRILSDSVFEVY
jgi:hypothetical protein